MINESQVKDILEKILIEEASKVSRQDFSKVHFKMDELENSLHETMKELRKLNETIPSGLENLTKNRISTINSNLVESQKLIRILKDKVRNYKRSLYAQSIDEKKNRI